MAKITAVIPQEMDEKLRDYIRGKGDISRIVIEALELWFKDQEKKGDKQK